MTFKLRILLPIILLCWIALSCSPSKEFDEHFTVNKESYKPYDTKFFYESVKNHARKGFVTSDSAFNYENVKLGFRDSTKLLMVVSPYFMPNTEEVTYLKNFVGAGNNAFIAAYNISSRLIDSLFYLKNSYQFNFVFSPELEPDSMKIAWFPSNTAFVYPGQTPKIPTLDSVRLYVHNKVLTPSPPINSVQKSSDSTTARAIDSTNTSADSVAIDSTNHEDEEDEYLPPINKEVSAIDTLMVDKNGKPQMLEIYCGKGRIFLLTNPMILSNYFLLHKQNSAILNQILLRLEYNDRTVVWDDFYKKFAYQRAERNENDSFLLEFIHRYPPLTWAFYTFLLGILLFILINFRRIQAPMKVLPPVENHSLAFVNVVSGLYWQQQNHLSIAEKMVHHFYEVLATQYRIAAKDFYKEQIDFIAQKTGKSKDLLESILSGIRGVETGEVSTSDLNELYKNIYQFYQNN